MLVTFPYTLSLISHVSNANNLKSLRLIARRCLRDISISLIGVMSECKHMRGEEREREKKTTHCKRRGYISNSDEWRCSPHDTSGTTAVALCRNRRVRETRCAITPSRRRHRRCWISGGCAGPPLRHSCEDCPFNADVLPEDFCFYITLFFCWKKNQQVLLCSKQKITLLYYCSMESIV